METLKQYEHKGLTVKIVLDDSPTNPREWSNVGTMVCFHGRYTLGDENQKISQEELEELVQRGSVISLPLYLYDHSGLTMKTSPFSCRWDSGQVGHIYVTREAVLKEYGKKILTKKLREMVLKQLKQEVETYNDYLQGNVYGFQVETPNGTHLDSCYGHYGLKEKAKGQADYHWHRRRRHCRCPGRRHPHRRQRHQRRPRRRRCRPRQARRHRRRCLRVDRPCRRRHRGLRQRC